MKTLKRPLFFHAALIAVLIFSKCTFPEDLKMITDSVDSLQVMVSTPEFNTGIHLEFVDAKTNEPIEETDVSVTISGRDADFVYNNIGSKQASYSSYWGMLDLVIDPHRVDTVSMSTNPIQFEVNASLTGYVSETQSVLIYDNNTQTITMPLINRNNPPDDVSFVEAEVDVNTDENGGLVEDFTIDFNTSGQNQRQIMKSQSLVSGISPKLIFPKGIVLLNTSDNIKSIKVSAIISNLPADGKPTTKRIDNFTLFHFLKYGAIKFTITAVLSNGQQRNVQRTSKGFIEMNVDVPNHYIHPETMLPIKESDKIVRIMTGNLKEKRMDEVKKIAGKLVLVGTLGEWPTDQQFWGKFIPSCSQPPKSKIVFNFDHNLTRKHSGSLDFAFFTSKHQKIAYNSSTPYGSWGMIEMKINRSLPEGSAKCVFYSNQNTLKFTPDTLFINSMCEEKTYYVGVESALFSTNKEWITLNLDFELISKSNNKLVIKPSAKTYLRMKDNSAGADLNFINGKASCLVMENADYGLIAAFGKIRAQGSLKVENDSPTTYKVTFTPQLSYNSVGTTETIIVPKTESKEISLKYQAIVSDDVFNQFK